MNNLILILSRKWSTGLACLILVYCCASGIIAQHGEINQYLKQSSDVIVTIHNSDWNSGWFDGNELRIELGTEDFIVAHRLFSNSYSSGISSWTGRIVGQRYGYIILSQKDHILTGKIELDDGRQFALASDITTGILHCVEARTSLAEQCQDLTFERDTPLESEGKDNSRFDTLCDSGDPCTDQVIDVLVFYTPRARQNMGGSSHVIETSIATAVSEVNLINLNSQIDHLVSLIHVEEINYNEASSFETNLDRLRIPTDGYIDEIHDIRDYYYADLVSLIVGRDECGLANVNTDSVQFDAQRSFSVVREKCLDDKVFAHELGHNLGFRHDQYSYLKEDGVLPEIACPHAWGYVNPSGATGSSSQRWRTVMSYNDQCLDQGFSCTRIAHWSNPDVLYNTEPTGTDDIDNMANNAAMFNKATCQVSQFREKPDCEEECRIYQGCSNYSLNTDLGPGYRTEIVITDDFPEVDPALADIQLCVMYFGDHNGSNEQFHVVSEDGSILGQTIPAFECDLPTRVCFHIDPEDYNAWINDQWIEVSLNPITSQINPEQCRANRACAEILIRTNEDPTAIIPLNRESSGLKMVCSPNPVADMGTFWIDVEKMQEVELCIFDLMGVRRAHLICGRLDQGRHRFRVNTSDYPPGPYVCLAKSSVGTVKSVMFKGKG